MNFKMKGDGELLSNRYRVSVSGDKILEMDGGDGWITI